MERFLTEYLINSIWQVPLLAAAAWLTVHVVRPGPRVQHRIWVGLLPLMLATPLYMPHSGQTAAAHALLPIVTQPSDDSSENVLAVPTSPLAATRIQASQMQTPDQASSPDPASQQALPARSHLPPRASWRPMHEMTLTPSATHWLVELYLVTLAFMVMRLLLSLWAAGRLVTQAKPAMLSEPTSELLDRCCQQLSVRRPRILLSPRTSGPMVVGSLRPSLLLPESFRNRIENPALHSERDLEAVWLHELAHLRRCDYLANLACRIVALPLDYHPATHAVQHRIRRTREMVCDEMAATEMQSPLRYARCLVGLARSMHPGSKIAAYGVGMFEGGVLEERIMQLIEAKPATSVWTRTIRLAGAVAMALAIIAAPAMFHVTPMLAQATGTASPDVAAGAAVPSANAVTSQPPDQAQPTPSAKPAASAAAAGQNVETRKKAEEAKAADAQSKVISVESRKQMEDARKRLDDAAKAWSDAAATSAESGAKVDSGDQQRMEDARKQLDDATRAWNDAVARTVDSALREKESTIYIAEYNKHLADAAAKFNSPEFQKQMADVQAKLNSPEFKKQIADAQAKINSPEFKEKMKNLNKQMADAQAKFNSPEFKAQIEKWNSPEFKKQIADAQAKINSPEFKEKMQNLSKQMADAQAKFNSQEFKVQIERFNNPVFNGQYQSQFLDSQMQEVRREIDDALRVWSEVENTPAK